MPARPRPRRVIVHQQVPYLVVPRLWRVGEATFWPAGHLERRIHRTVHDGTLSAFMVEPLKENPTWATVSATGRTAVVRGKEDIGPAVEEATSKTRDAIAALRLLKLAAVRYLDTSLQDFGLSTDIASVRIDWWIFTPAGRWKSSNAGRRGSLGDWTFTTEMVGRYRSDPRFRYLDAALRSPTRSDLQNRILTALRTLMIATPVYRPATRIVLAATALEALFGDPYAPGRSGIGAHELARRAAFLWCGSESNDRHGPSRGACPFLTEPTGNALVKRIAGTAWVCSYYGDLRDLYDDRSRAVHSGDDRFTTKVALSHEFTVERIALLALEWAASTGATSFAEYRAAIAALPPV